MVLREDKYYKWDYSEKDDILNVHARNKKVVGSAELGDFTLDFDKNHNIVGVEILHFAEFSEQVGITKDQLQQMQRVEILVNNRNPSIAYAVIKVILPNSEVKFPLPAPIEACASA